MVAVSASNIITRQQSLQPITLRKQTDINIVVRLIQTWMVFFSNFTEKDNMNWPRLPRSWKIWSFTALSYHPSNLHWYILRCLIYEATSLPPHILVEQYLTTNGWNCLHEKMLQALVWGISLFSILLKMYSEYIF